MQVHCSMKLLKNNLPYLKLLSASKPQQRQLLIKYATSEQLKSLIEIVTNVLYGVIPISTELIKKLKRYKKVIIDIGNKYIRKAEKKKKLLHISSKLVLLLKHILPVLKTLSKS